MNSSSDTAATLKCVHVDRKEHTARAEEGDKGLSNQQI